VVKQQAAATPHLAKRAAAPTGASGYAAGTATFSAGGGPILHPQLAPSARWRKRPGLRFLFDCADEAERVAERPLDTLKLRYVVLTACRPPTTWPTTRQPVPPEQMAADTAAAIPMIANRRMLTPEFSGAAFAAKRKDGAPAQQQRPGRSPGRQSPGLLQPQNRGTVQRLQGQVRRGAHLTPVPWMLAACRSLAPRIPTKSGLIAGPGRNARGGDGGPGRISGRGMPSAFTIGPIPAAFPGSPASESLLRDPREIYEAAERLAQGRALTRCAADHWCRSSYHRTARTKTLTSAGRSGGSDQWN